MSWCVCRRFAWFVRRIACTRVTPMLFIHAICWFCQRFASRMLSHCTRVWNHQFASSTRLEWYRFRLEKSTRKVPWYVFSLPKFRRSAAIRWYHLLGALTKPYIAVNEWTQWWCSNCNFRDHSGICSQNVSEIGCPESILKFSSSSKPLWKTHTLHVSFVSMKTKWSSTCQDHLTSQTGFGWIWCWHCVKPFVSYILRHRPCFQFDHHLWVLQPSAFFSAEQTAIVFDAMPPLPQSTSQMCWVLCLLLFPAHAYVELTMSTHSFLHVLVWPSR